MSLLQYKYSTRPLLLDLSMFLKYLVKVAYKKCIGYNITVNVLKNRTVKS